MAKQHTCRWVGRGGRGRMRHSARAGPGGDTPTHVCLEQRHGQVIAVGAAVDFFPTLGELGPARHCCQVAGARSRPWHLVVVCSGLEGPQRVPPSAPP